MTPSTILAAAVRILLPVFLLFSVFLLLRGHNEAGGGFVGGLIAAAGFALFALANGWGAARKALAVDPRLLILVGLVTAGGSGLLALAGGAPFMTGLWVPASLPVIGKAGTPLLFDVGVYFVVFGTVMQFLISLGEEQ
jgi:multicomponent Na+:H+ antiporter subunit B